MARAKQVGTATQASRVHEARAIVAKGKNYGLPVVIGRLYYSPRRFGWIFRFEERMDARDIDGSFFEPVEKIAA